MQAHGRGMQRKDAAGNCPALVPRAVARLDTDKYALFDKLRAVIKDNYSNFVHGESGQNKKEAQGFPSVGQCVRLWAPARKVLGSGR